MEEKPPQKNWPDNLKDWQKDQVKTYRTYIKTSAVGLEFGLSIALAALAGYYIDKYFGWSPYGLIVGIIIGTAAGVKRLWQFAKKYMEKGGSDEDPE